MCASDGSTEFHEAMQPVGRRPPSLPVTLEVSLAQHTGRETG
jgi:hypothetical protein